MCIYIYIYTYTLAHSWRCFHQAAAAKSLHSCPTLCHPIDGNPLGSSVPGILQARKLEWVAISFSSAWKWKVKMKSLSRARLLATPWTAGYQAPPSMGFSRQEYWSGFPLPSLIHIYIWYIYIYISYMNTGTSNFSSLILIPIFFASLCWLKIGFSPDLLLILMVKNKCFCH